MVLRQKIDHTYASHDQQHYQAHKRFIPGNQAGVLPFYDDQIPLVSADVQHINEISAEKWQVLTLPKNSNQTNRFT